MVTRVVCLGGGYTAVWFAKELRKSIRDGMLDVSIVSRDSFHTFHGFIHEMLTGKVQPGQIISPARRLFPPAKFYNCEIEAVDLGRRTVTASRLLDGQQYVLEFDHLVLGVGSIDDLSRYAGIAEHAQKLKSYADCFRTRNHILAMLELAEIEPDPTERRRLLTFVIAGGNFGGIEIATEMHDYLHALAAREYCRINAEELRIVVAHSGERILPELQRHPALVDWAEACIARKKIEVLVRTRVAAATAEEVVLTNGDRIPTRTVISCTGTAQSPLLDTLDLPRDDRGRVQTNEFLQVGGHSNVWAGGDCAAVPHPQGGICPPLGIFAITAGRQIARNIKRAAAGRPLEKYRFTGIGDACSLGSRQAVAHVRGYGFTGLTAWLAWRILLLMFVPAWERKVRMLLDWIVSPLVGRDIVKMNVDPPYDIRRELFDTGQDIVRQGDVGRRLYVIWSGEVDVIRNSAAGSETIATLGRGQHFGEIAVFQDARRTATVRARTRVELISIGQQEAIALTRITDRLAHLRDLPEGKQPCD